MKMISNLIIKDLATKNRMTAKSVDSMEKYISCSYFKYFVENLTYSLNNKEIISLSSR